MTRGDKIKWLKGVESGKIALNKTPPFMLDNVTDQELDKFLNVMGNVKAKDFPVSKDSLSKEGLSKEDILFLEEFCVKTQAQIKIIK